MRHYLEVGITSGITHDLVIWRYNPHSAFRVLTGHRDWVEALCVVPTAEVGAAQLLNPPAP
jgi:hypothetical protein